MGKHTSFILATISVVWMIMSEDISWRGLAIGLLVSMVCMHFSAKFLPFEEVYDINFNKLTLYPPYLLWQVLLAGFHVAKLVLKDAAKTGIVFMPTKIESETLQVMLMYSIALTPGSIPFEINGNTITTLWLHDKKLPNDVTLAEEITKAAIEKRLQVAELKNVVRERI